MLPAATTSLDPVHPSAKSLHSDAYRSFVSVLALKRRSVGMTQQQVADRLGKPQSYVAKIERAERHLDIVEFVALSRALGLNPSELFDEVLAVFDGD